MTLISVLRALPLFSGLLESELKQIADTASAVSYGKGAMVLKEGEVDNAMFLLLRGKVKVYVSEPEGREFVLAVLGPGEYVGELSMLDSTPNSASVIAEEPCNFLVLQKDDFMQTLIDNPSIQFKLLLNLTRRSRELTEVAKSLALKGVYSRLRRLLESLAVPYRGQLQIRDALTQQDIADRVGASREMVARILKELTQGGYVRYDDKRLVFCRKLPEAF
jgi:CRP/FNR family cyclic AMP-dependent transcriptional regulator